MLIHRPARTLDDLHAAGLVTTRAWQADEPLVAATPAGIEWWYASTAPDPLEAHLRIWSEGGRERDRGGPAAHSGGDVAWSWHDAGEVEWHAWSGDPRRDAEVFRVILETAIEEAGATAVGTWTAEDDSGAIAVLVDLGFLPADKRLSQFQWRPSEETASATPPDVPVPEGYRIRRLAGRHEIPARVDVHRAAFSPSRLTIEKYERLLTVPHYRFEDDLVVEAQDRTLVAFAMAWWDGDAGVGEFEPVGTHPDHRRKGLSRALLTWGLRRYAERDARVVQVYSDTGNTASEALYEAVGFRRRAFHRRYERPGGPGPDLQSGP